MSPSVPKGKGKTPPRNSKNLEFVTPIPPYEITIQMQKSAWMMSPHFLYLMQNFWEHKNMFFHLEFHRFTSKIKKKKRKRHTAKYSPPSLRQNWCYSEARNIPV